MSIFKLAAVALTLSAVTYGADSITDKEKSTPYPPTSDYRVDTIEGFKVLVNKELTDEHPELEKKTLRLVEDHLYRINRVVPETALAELKKIPIWIEYRNRLDKHRCMCYHPGRKWLVDNDFNPDKTDSVELSCAENFLIWTIQQPWMIMHELAHGYHDTVVKHGHPELEKAYQKAVESKKYESVMHISGKNRRAYALNNTQEYFAEASEAFFGTNDFYPFVKSELKQHDPELYTLLQKLWDQ